MKVILGLFFGHDENDKKVVKKVFIHSIHKTITLEINSNVLVDDIIKSIKTICRLSKQMEGSRFSFKFVSSLSIRCRKVNEAKDSAYIKSPEI